MITILELLKSEFANHVDIVNHVGTECSYLMELQKTKAPFITYNLQEIDDESKDGSRDYNLIIFVISDTPIELLTIYESVVDVINNKINTSGFYKSFKGSSFPEKLDPEKEGNYIIEINFNINN